MMMKRFCLGFIAAGLVSIGAGGGVPATAADLQPVHKAPVFNWNGFYIGANVGGAWAGNTVTEGNILGTISATTNVGSSGVAGGGHAGYNWQAAPNWLLGIEADVSGAAPKGSGSDRFGSFDEKVNAFGTVRGRVGYVVNNWLFYGTGGFGWANDAFTRTPTNQPPGPGANSATRTGWAAGAGIEYGLARNWTLRAEYLHVDLGDRPSRTTALPCSLAVPMPWVRPMKGGSPSTRFARA
jgi:outer membrane immunogenic protein